MTSLRPALHRAVLAVDIERFGDRARTNSDQVRAREGLYRAIHQAFDRSAIPWAECHHEDRGDGILLLIPPEVPKIRLSGHLPRQLATELVRHNQHAAPGGRIRLRLVLHAGEVHYDDHGVAGSCINMAFRLLEAPSVKRALADSQDVLVIVASEWFFEEVIRHDPQSVPSAYRRVAIGVKETQTTALVRLPSESETEGRTPIPRRSTRPPDTEWSANRKVPRRNRAFTGRQAILDRLENTLVAVGFDDSSLPACVLYGMGGVGKTQIAREYAHRYAAHYHGVWWVDAGQPFSLTRGLSELAHGLGVVWDDTPQRAQALYRELAERGRWLLVYDNVEDEEEIEAWWPIVDVGGILVTSRTSTWTIADPIRVEPFTRRESLAFLGRTTEPGQEPSPQEEREAEEVARTLGDLPLALAQAAAYVTRNHTGWTRYHGLLRQAPARVLHLNPPDDYVGTASTTWALSMTRVEEEQPASEALLRLYAFVDSERIPRDLVRPGVVELPPALRTLAEDPVSHDLAIGALAEYALIDATAETLSMHPIVQTMVRSSLPADQQHAWIKAAASLLDLQFPERPRLPDAWQACTSLLPHVAAVARYARTRLAAASEVSRICQRAAAYLEVRDEFEEALELLDHSLALGKHAFGSESMEYAEALTSRGEAECYLGHHRVAVEIARTAMSIKEKVDGAQAPSLISTLRLLGRALTEAGSPVEASGILQRAADICEHSFGMADARTAEVVARLAYAHWRAGDLELARTSYDRADHLWSLAGSASDRERTVAYRWMANALCDLRELASARTTIEKAIHMAHELYGPEHVETVRAKETLGTILAASGNLAEGERLQRRAAQFLRAFYPVPVVIAGTLTALSRTILRAGRPEEALSVATEASEMYVSGHGKISHAYYAGALTALGMAQRSLGRVEDAAENLRHARDIYERAGGPSHLLVEVLCELERC